MRRRRGAGRAVVSALTLSLLLSPFTAASQQHERISHRKSPHQQAAVNNHHTDPGPSEPRDGSAIETTNYKHLKDTTLNQRQASAVATNPLALAGENRAVRAVQSARGSGNSAGLSTPLNARSLQDWEVEDFVLLATVDGSIHARDRKTGAARWELEVEAPMVETTYHPQNKSALGQSKPEYDFLWIVEPSRDGDIYIYNQGGLGGLQKLHLTVKQLVADMSPYESVDPAVVYNAEKRTKLYTVDATTGVINKVFGSGSGSAPSREPRCPKPGGLEVLDDEECGSRGSFVLGRTEYTITIQNRDTTEPICTLKYSEWGPNTRDGDLHSQYSSTMDNKYVFPLHDGSIFGWDYGQMMERQKSYTQKLSSPVVRVFDVARPSQSDDPDPQLIVLPQPVGPIDNDIYDPFSAKNRIFVNHTEAGGWFAMSEMSYPLVTGKAKAAQCYNKDWLEWTSSIQSLSLAQRQEGVVGVHSLTEYETRQGSGLTISAPEHVDDNDSPVDIYDKSAFLPSIPNSSKIIQSATSNAYDIILVFLFSLGLFFVYVNHGHILKRLRQIMEIGTSPTYVRQSLKSVSSTPVAATASWSEDPAPIEAENVEITIEQAADSDIVTRQGTTTLLEPPPDNLRSRTNSLRERGRAEQATEGKGVRIQEPSPGPGDDDEMGNPQPGKKKARRGKRGGAKRAKNRSDSTHQSREEAEKPTIEMLQQPEEPPAKIDPLPVVPLAATEVNISMTGPIINIGHLSVDTDTILGFGGHGTMVFKGTFGGRDVAVKRMLKEFYDIVRQSFFSIPLLL